MFPSLRGSLIPSVAATILALPALGHSQSTTVMNVDSGGDQSADGATDPSATGDGRLVMFASSSDDLVPNDTNNRTDVFVHNTVTGNTMMVSVDPSGNPGDEDSGNPFVTATGTHVVYDSHATNIAGGGGSYQAVFLTNMATGTTTAQNLSTLGAFANGNCHTPTVSNDGRYVAFVGMATNLTSTDTNSLPDCFLRDRLTQTTVCLSLNFTGTDTGAGVSSLPQVSGDGQFVAFLSTAPDLVPNDNNGVQDLFVYSIATGQLTRISEALGGGDANGASFDPRFSRNGRYLTFHSSASDLILFDTNGGLDCFMYDMTTGILTRESLASGGVQLPWSGVTASVSNDGNLFTFRSRDTILPGGGNGNSQVYVRNRALDITYPASVSPEGALADDYTLDAEITGDGKIVIFTATATNMVAGDTNGAIEDVFARKPGKAAWSLYGTGLAGFNGPPDLSLSAEPILGTTLDMQVTRSSIKPAQGFFFVGLDSATIPTNWGGDILVDFDLIYPLFLATPTMSLPFSLDDDPTWEGLEVYVQLLQIDPAAQDGISFSPGLEMTLGY